jgi:hypothetical protein
MAKNIGGVKSGGKGGFGHKGGTSAGAVVKGPGNRMNGMKGGKAMKGC